MIFINNPFYAKVWKVQERRDKYMDLRISTSEKDQAGDYIDSNWFPRVIGHAFNALKDVLQDGDRIVVKKAKFTNEKFTDKEGNIRSSFRFLILDAEVQDSQETKRPAAETVATEQSQPSVGDDNPW